MISAILISCIFIFEDEFMISELYLANWITKDDKLVISIFSSIDKIIEETPAIIKIKLDFLNLINKKISSLIGVSFEASQKNNYIIIRITI